MVTKLRKETIERFVNANGYEIAEKQGITAASSASNLSRPTVYAILQKYPKQPKRIIPQYIKDFETTEDLSPSLFTSTVTVQTVRKFTARLQEVLEALNLPLKVIWAPCSNRAIHGEIKQETIFIYDENKEDAIETFQHELYEYKFKEVTHLYMAMTNALLEILQKEIYSRKKAFFDSLPSLQRAIQSLKK
jgi:hypothetical protein